MVAADRLEVDETLDQLLERVDVERVEIVGREHARHGAEPQPFARHEREQPLDDVALQVSEMAVDAHRAPEIGEPLARLFRPAAGEPVGEHDRIHRSRRRAGHAFDLDAAVLEQLVEHPPGESAMGAASLQGEIDRLARAASALPGCERPPPRSSRLERIGNEICEQNGKHSRRGVVGMSSEERVIWWRDCCIAIYIMALQQERNTVKAIKIRACRKPNPRASKLRGGGPSFPRPVMTTTAARPMRWPSPRRYALSAANA